MRKNNILAITAIEIGNSEAPNIGTITGSNIEELTEKFKDALMRHFDADIDYYSIQDGLTLEDVENGSPLDVNVTINGLEYPVEISETWVY
jgi:hypothetical protein